MVSYICKNKFVNVWVVDIIHEFGSETCVWKIVSWVVVIEFERRKCIVMVLVAFGRFRVE